MRIKGAFRVWQRNLTVYTKLYKSSLVPERNITLRDWTGVGYIIYDPTNGGGAFMITGGYGGAQSVVASAWLDMCSMEELSANAEGSMKKDFICYPGKEHTYDVCYDVQSWNDLIKANECADVKACKLIYNAPTANGVMPLIYTYEDGKNDDTFLSATVQVEDWKSPDTTGGKHRYMRAGRAIVEFLDHLLYIYRAQKMYAESMVVNAGYRTLARAKYLKTHGYPKASLTSNHIRGVASDFKLMDKTGQEIKKCKIIFFVVLMIGGSAEIMSEGSDMGNAFHTAIPSAGHTDAKDYPTDFKECK